jgi:hypothetical protein
MDSSFPIIQVIARLEQQGKELETTVKPFLPDRSAVDANLFL